MISLLVSGYLKETIATAGTRGLRYTLSACREIITNPGGTMSLRLLFLVAIASARAQGSCPAQPPGSFAIQTANLTSGDAYRIPYASGEQIRYRIIADKYAIQPCDTVTADFGDGSPLATFPATGELVHSFQTTSYARLTTKFTLGNSLGSSELRWDTYVTKSWAFCPIWPPDYIIFGGIAGQCSVAPDYSACDAGKPLSFSVNAIGFGGLQEACTIYTWQFGDGTGGTGRIAEHTYKSGGRYTVHVSVVNAYGSAASDFPLILRGQLARRRAANH